jgi:hypothetical protein
MAQAATTPTYTWWDQVPENLKTKTQLNELGFKPGPEVRAHIEYGRGRRYRCYDLYDITEATPKQQATPAQLAALEQARIAQRTCKFCGAVVEKPSYLSPKGRCPDCLAVLRRQKRNKERDATILWARDLMRRDDWLIVDTETTSLDGYAVEIGIIAPDGSTVFESLVSPEVEIEPGAQEVHGITRQMLWGAPTFADLEPDLRRILHGKTVIAYNASFDRNVFEREIRRMCRPPEEALDLLMERRWFCFSLRSAADDRWSITPDGPGDWRLYHDGRDEYIGYIGGLVYEQATWWVGRSDWQDAMDEYSTFVGEWHDYYQDYRWQALPGSGHRAVGDCRACLDVIRSMAQTPLSSEVSETVGA